MARRFGISTNERRMTISELRREEYEARRRREYEELRMREPRDRIDAIHAMLLAMGPTGLLLSQEATAEIQKATLPERVVEPEKPRVDNVERVPRKFDLGET